MKNLFNKIRKIIKENYNVLNISLTVISDGIIEEINFKKEPLEKIQAIGFYDKKECNEYNEEE